MNARDRLYIGGRWVPSAGGTAQRIDVENPATEEIFGHVPDGTAADMDRAVRAARTAFDDGPWPRLSPAERADAVTALADGLSARSDELTQVITAETGLPVSLVGYAHVRGAIHGLRHAARVAREAEPETAHPGTLFPFTVRRVPVGVVGAIVPWNIPLLGACAKIGPALAAGCTVVLKPSPETPLSAYLIADAAEAAGLPPGVFNLVPAGREAGAALVGHPGVDKITFTGSTAAGKRIAAACAEQVKRCSLELGGNAAAIVLDDAPLERAAAGIVAMSLSNNNGEACLVQGRALVPRHREREFLDAVETAASAVRPGDPTDPSTRLGPMITRAHRDRVLDHVESGRSDGARVVCGGRVPEHPDRGWYVEPTVLAGVDPGMRVSREEVFGPVLTVTAYDDEREAIALANDTEYGLTGSVWGADPARAAAVGSRIRAGSIYVNGAFALDADAPFGGFKQSGLGREGGPDSIGQFLEPQVVYTPRAGA